MKTVYLFSNCYPYGMVAESFLTEELLVASQIPNLHIEIIPLHKNEYRRDLPLNVTLNTKLSNTSFLQKIKIFFLMLLSRYFWLIPFQGKYSPLSISDYSQALKYLYGSFLIKHFLLKNKKTIIKEGILYSYWFNHTPLGLCMAKKSSRHFEKSAIYTRAHGFDVYEKNVGVYFPYRNEVLAMINHVFVVSETGVSCLRKRYPDFATKIEVSRLGVFSNQIKECIDEYWDISVLSCSNIGPIKRVDLIFRSINGFCQINEHLNVKWTHIGGGEGFNALQKEITCKHRNLTIDLTGSVNKQKVMEIYQRGYFNLFINMSLSEGVPVSIMEAISWGIPVLATNVGGNKEIVTKDTGFLLSANVDQEQFNELLLGLVKNKESLSRSAFAFYHRNFNAQSNYTYFYRDQLK